MLVLKLNSNALMVLETKGMLDYLEISVSLLNSERVEVAYRKAQ